VERRSEDLKVDVAQVCISILLNVINNAHAPFLHRL